jgi:hypothetical protein
MMIKDVLTIAIGRIAHFLTLITTAEGNVGITWMCDWLCTACTAADGTGVTDTDGWGYAMVKEWATVIH